MRILSVKQPWASLLVEGIKDVENREWSTHYRGPVAIHASRKPDKSEGAIWALANHLPGMNYADLPTGVVLGVVEIVDVVRESNSPWFFGTFGLVVANARMLTHPIPHLGSLGLNSCPPELERRFKFKA